MYVAFSRYSFILSDVVVVVVVVVNTLNSVLPSLFSVHQETGYESLTFDDVI